METKVLGVRIPVKLWDAIEEIAIACAKDGTSKTQVVSWILASGANKVLGRPLTQGIEALL